jgi:hypothetical protein
VALVLTWRFVNADLIFLEKLVKLDHWLWHLQTLVLLNDG